MEIPELFLCVYRVCLLTFGREGGMKIILCSLSQASIDSEP